MHCNCNAYLVRYTGGENMENTEREIAQSVYDTLIGNLELECALP